MTELRVGTYWIGEMAVDHVEWTSVEEMARKRVVLKLSGVIDPFKQLRDLTTGF